MIRKGQAWGVPAEVPADVVGVASDAELAHLLAVRPAAAVTLTGGDLHRTLGRPAAVVAGATARLVPIDVLRCELDGEPHVAVAHVVVRPTSRLASRLGSQLGSWSGWWHGPIHGVFNAEYLGRWDVAPRGHPNDGRAEVVEVDAAMTVRQRCQAWRRLPSGSHVPHPLIASSHRSSVEWVFERPLAVALDGVAHQGVTHLRVTVEPDAAELYI